MEERFVKIGDKFYYESEVKKMSLEEIVQLLKDCRTAIQDIAIKKGNYKANNKEGFNSKKFLRQMSNYKVAAIRIQQGMEWINEIKKQKNVEGHIDREHWFFCFYREAFNILPKFIFNKIKDKATDKAGFEIDVNLEA